MGRHLSPSALSIGGDADCAAVVGVATLPHTPPRLVPMGILMSDSPSLDSHPLASVDLATHSMMVRLYPDYRYAGNESFQEDAGQMDIDATHRQGMFSLTMLEMARYVSANCPRALQPYWGLPSDLQYPGGVPLSAVIEFGQRAGCGFAALHYMTLHRFSDVVGHKPLFLDSEQLENASEKVSREVLAYYGEPARGNGRFVSGLKYCLAEYMLSLGRSGEGGGLLVICPRHVAHVLRMFQEYVLEKAAIYGIPIVFSQLSRYYQVGPRDSDAPSIPPFLEEISYGRLRVRGVVSEGGESEEEDGGLYFLLVRLNRRRWRSATFGHM